jgi:G protein-coupled receptor 157
MGSVLWTINLAIYLYFKVITIRLHPRSRMMRVLTIGLYIVGYGLPFYLAMYYYAQGLIGPNEFLSSGWCTINVFDSTTGDKFILPYLIGYDMWMYIALVLIPILVIATKYQIDSESIKKKTGTSPIMPVVKSSWKSVEMKLMAIPVIFLLLRIWSICTGVIFIYSNSYCWVDPNAVKALSYLSGIGDSGQGFFNGILFVILTKSVRESFVKKLLRLCCRPQPEKGRLLLADAKYHKGPIGPPSSSVP